MLYLHYIPPLGGSKQCLVKQTNPPKLNLSLEQTYINTLHNTKTMTYFIFLSGTLGSGKTTCAKQLTKLLNAEIINLDKVLKDNKIEHEDTACVPLNNYIKGIDLILPLAKKLLKNNKILIFDSCLFHKEALDYLIKELPFPHYVFTLKASLDVCIERDRQRKNTIGEDVARDVYELTNKNNFGIIINTDNKSSKETVKEIISHLPK